MANITDPENTIIIELKDGNVTIELLADIAPKHVARMKELARSGQYDNVAFHRVIEGFMAQTGDVQHGDMADGFNLRMAGTGASNLPDLPAEFSKLPHDRGTIGAARSSNPDSANSQFFINFGENHFLNGQYTVYGRVISGMEHVDSIAAWRTTYGARSNDKRQGCGRSEASCQEASCQEASCQEASCQEASCQEASCQEASS